MNRDYDDDILDALRSGAKTAEQVGKIIDVRTKGTATYLGRLVYEGRCYRHEPAQREIKGRRCAPTYSLEPPIVPTVDMEAVRKRQMDGYASALKRVENIGAMVQALMR